MFVGNLGSGPKLKSEIFAAELTVSFRNFFNLFFPSTIIFTYVHLSKFSREKFKTFSAGHNFWSCRRKLSLTHKNGSLKSFDKIIISREVFLRTKFSVSREKKYKLEFFWLTDNFAKLFRLSSCETFPSCKFQPTISKVWKLGEINLLKV